MISWGHAPSTCKSWHFCYFMWRCGRWQQWMLLEDGLLGNIFLAINTILPRSALERTWNLHTTRGHVYLVPNETTNALVWCTCNMVPTTPWAIQLSQESYIEHREKKKGYETSTSYNIATKHKHDTNKLVETFGRGHKTSYKALFSLLIASSKSCKHNLDVCHSKLSTLKKWQHYLICWNAKPRWKPSRTQHKRSKRIPFKTLFNA